MTDSTQINWREPQTFAAGDTLLFQRNLRDYLPQNGWALVYEIRGAGLPIEFNSVALNQYHSIEVDGPTTQNWPAGQFVLAGFAINAGNANERHQIYYGELEIFPNIGALANQQPQTTHAQRMVLLIEAALEKLAANALQRTSVEQTEIDRVRRLDLEKQLAINKEIRAGEIALENVRAGRPSGRRITSQMNIVSVNSAMAVNQTGNLIP